MFIVEITKLLYFYCYISLVKKKRHRKITNGSQPNFLLKRLFLLYNKKFVFLAKKVMTQYYGSERPSYGDMKTIESVFALVVCIGANNVRLLGKCPTLRYD